jgi:hypothetical protein
MKEGEPSPNKPTEIVIAQYGPDVPDGITFDLDQYAHDAYMAEFGKELTGDGHRLIKLRKEAVDPPCPCKACRSTNLRERRAITKKWQVPDRKDTK